MHTSQAMAREFLLAGDHVLITSRSQSSLQAAMCDLRKECGDDSQVCVLERVRERERVTDTERVRVHTHTHTQLTNFLSTTCRSSVPCVTCQTHRIVSGWSTQPSWH